MKGLIAFYLCVCAASGADFRTDSDLVLVPVSVTDSMNHAITGLDRRAFRVFDDKTEQTLIQFAREDVPLSVGIVFDSSGSMRDKRQGVESAALALVRDSNPQDEAFIVNFNDEAYLDADFTSDIKVMEQGLTKIDSRGGTARGKRIGE